MSAIDLLQRLWTATLALSAALAIVAALRVPWRRWFGAEQACRLWWLPALAVMASQLPHASMQTVIVRVPTILAAAAPVSSVPVVAANSVDWRAPLAFAWFAGSCALLLLAVARQRRFLRALREARPASLAAPEGISEVLSARNIATGPALVGAWRPRLVLPRDFEQRY